jgi:hypothetical protein
MHSVRKSHKIWTIVLSTVGFMTPIILKEDRDSWNSVLSLSFTILGTLLSIATLLIAMLLFDRFGINAKFKDRQVDKVLELAIYLKETNISASTNKFRYFINASQSFISRRYEFPQYKTDENKTILFPGNYEELFKQLNEIRNNYWLPQEIKIKMKFLEIYGLADVENHLEDQYVRLDINNNAQGEWKQSFPRITLEMFNINLHDLLREIDVWLKKHSNVTVDLKL